MTYPFVAAAEHYGARKGPAKAFVVHMAEGGGTVGFLSRDNARGVSVHYVIEYTGRIVQMVRESEATGSINPKDLRTTNDPKVYGATVRKAVMGAWDNDPNSAVISCEIEGFASTGPNAAEHGSLKKLSAEIRARYPGIGLLGHRDFQDYKACPGKLVHWDDIGGHGPAQEEPMQKFGLSPTVPIGTYVLNVDTALIAMDESRVPVLKGRTGHVFAKAVLPDDRPAYLVGYADTTGLLVADTRCTFTPAVTADCQAAVDAALDHVAPTVVAVGKAIDEARLR